MTSGSWLAGRYWVRMSSSGCVESIRWSSMAVMMSPSRKPAISAGLPGLTPGTLPSAESWMSVAMVDGQSQLLRQAGVQGHEP